MSPQKSTFLNQSTIPTDSNSRTMMLTHQQGEEPGSTVEGEGSVVGGRKIVRDPPANSGTTTAASSPKRTMRTEQETDPSLQNVFQMNLHKMFQAIQPTDLAPSFTTSFTPAEPPNHYSNPSSTHCKLNVDNSSISFQGLPTFVETKEDIERRDKLYDARCELRRSLCELYPDDHGANTMYVKALAFYKTNQRLPETICGTDDEEEFVLEQLRIFASFA